MGRRRSPNGQSEDSGLAEGPQSLADDTAGGAPATAHPSAAWDSARQTLDRNGRAMRVARCPTHKRIARRFLGVNVEGWVFSCAEGPHNFVAAPDPMAPRTAYEAALAATEAKAPPPH